MKTKWNFAILVLLCGNVIVEKLSEAAVIPNDELEIVDIDPSEWPFDWSLESPDKRSSSKLSEASAIPTGEYETQDEYIFEWPIDWSLESPEKRSSSKLSEASAIPTDDYETQDEDIYEWPLDWILESPEKRSSWKLSEASAIPTDDYETQDEDISELDLVYPEESPEKRSSSKLSGASATSSTDDLVSQDIDTSERDTLYRPDSSGESSASPQETTTEPWTPVPEEKCGISAVRVNNRIVGGDIAEPHSWPWQIKIACKNTTHYTWCGGSLISDRWVVTAAHCLLRKGFNYVILSECEVSLGRHYFSDGPSYPVVRTVGIRNFFIHGSYEFGRTDLGFDIALLELNEVISFDDNIRPICLSFDLPELNSDSVCYATGWGVYDPPTERSSDVLKQLQMPIQAVDYCGYTKKAIGPIICAGDWEWGQDICSGDSGGPLACREENGKWYLRGVSSMAMGGCNTVASFTKVTGFKDWIVSKISTE